MSVRDSIIKELEHGVAKKAEVIERVKISESVTIQAVYKELRALVKHEVVLDAQKKLSLTLTYIEKEHKKWCRVLEEYTHKVSFDDFLHLAKGKSHTFTFGNIVDLDLFWTQAFIILERILPSDIPRYSILAHDWFTYGRPATDDVWTNRDIHNLRLLVTHPTEVDWQMARRRRAEGCLFTAGENPLKLSDRQYCTVVSDWLFEIEFDAQVANELNSYLRSLKKIADADAAKMEKFMNAKGTFKLKLSNNPKKAQEYAQKVKKYFE